MFELSVEGRFSAAHRHRGAGDGGVHGHDFLVIARVAGENLIDDVVVDFHEVESSLRRHLAQLHYHDLDQLEAFSGREATPAAIARHLFECLAPAIGDPARLQSVEVHDGERSGARYSATQS